MKYLICFDLKRYVRQSKTWIMLALISSISLIYINNILLKGQTAYSDEVGVFFQQIADIGLSDSDLVERYQETATSLKILKEVGLEARIENYLHNDKEYNRLAVLGNLILAKERAENTSKLRLIALQYITKDIWEEVAGGIDYNNISFTGFNTGLAREDYYTCVMRAKYFYEIYDKGYSPVGKEFIDGTTFLYHYMNRIIPLLLGFLITMLLFDCITSDRANDNLKLLLTQPIIRRNYIFSKIISGFIYSVFVLLAPAIVITFIWGIKDLFRNLKYPVLYLKEGFSSFKVLENNIEFDKINQGFNMGIGLSYYSGIPKGSGAISPRIGFMPLYQFLLLGLFIVLLNILFFVTLNVFLSSLIKNRFISFILSILVTAVGTGGSSMLLSNSHKNISPFSMNNAVRILNGTYETTPLSSVTIIGVSIIGLLFVTLLFFRKRNL